MKISRCFTCWILAALSHQCLANECDIKRLDNTRYIVNLWGREITRSCGKGERFDVDACQCINAFRYVPFPQKKKDITGGQTVDISSVPWSLSLNIDCHVSDQHTRYKRYHPSFVCSATLIHKRWALSAAHCVLDDVSRSYCRRVLRMYKKRYSSPDIDKYLRNPRWTFVMKGGSTISDIQSVNDMTAEVLHTYISDESDLDIVLLRLDASFLTYKSVIPIPLAKPHIKLKSQVCSQIGFGEQQKGKRDKKLYWADTDVLTKCPVGAFIDFTYKSWMLCAIDKVQGTNICSGDSGGGLICYNEIQGYVIRGVAHGAGIECVRNHVAVYASTDAWYDAITRIMREVDGASLPDRCKRC